MDSDTGPVIGGIGVAATGFGIAAARSQGDLENLRGMLFGLELLGMPWWSPRGEKSYFGGIMLLPDVLALWGKTVRNWAPELGRSTANPWPAPASSRYWVGILIACLLGAAMVAVTLCALIAEYRRAKQNSHRWQTAHIAVLVFDAAVITAWMAVAQLPWLMAILLMGVMEVIENKWVRE